MFPLASRATTRTLWPPKASLVVSSSSDCPMSVGHGVRAVNGSVWQPGAAALATAWPSTSSVNEATPAPASVACAVTVVVPGACAPARRAGR